MVFVDREEELKALENAFDMFRRGHLHGVLVYGFRKVGKTALVRRFVEKHGGYLLDLSWVNSVESLVKLVTQRVGIALDNMPEDPADVIAVALKGIDEKLSEEGRVAPVVLDEFHVLLERLPKKIAKRYGLRMNEVFTDIVWKLRSVITSSRNAFWILVSSVGWVMLREYLEERKKAKGALLGVLGRLHVKPLSRDACMDLARALMRSADEDAIGGVAELSGGIPKIVEVLAMRYNTTRENPLKLAINAMTDGEFDELFESMIRFLAEYSRREFDTLVQALKAVAEGCKTANEVAEFLGTSRDSAYIVLEELVRLGLLDREKERVEVRYRLSYPLMREWLVLRVEPRRDTPSLLARAFGITAESYFRELLREAEGKVLEIYEGRRGEMFYGTKDKFILRIKRVFSKKETENFLRGIENADVIAEDENILVFEVKAVTREISPQEIRRFSERVRKIREEVRDKNVMGIFVLVEGEPSRAAVAEAVRENITILSPNFVKLLAKKLNFPHW